MQGAGRTGLRCQIAFANARTWMCTGAVQFATNPSGKILAELPDLLGPRQIERMLKPTAFSIANPGTPSNAPTSKRQKINLNTPPYANRQPSLGGYNRGRSSYARGRGNGAGRSNVNLHRRYNAATQTSAFQYFPVTPSSDRIPVFRSPIGTDLGPSTKSTNASANVRIQEVDRSPMRGRILSFDEE